MPASSETAARSQRVASENIPVVCQWLTHGVPYVDRIESDRGHDAIFEVVSQGNRVGAVWVAIQPGRTATLQGPRVQGSDAHAVRGRLMQSVEEHLDEHDIVVVQALLTDDRAAIPDPLAEYGFQHVVEIEFLARSLSQGPDQTDANCGVATDARRVAFENCTEATSARLAKVIEATYQQTMDCPALNQARSLEDVLAGYRTIGKPTADAWQLVRSEGRDIGCLLMADHPDRDECEIVYLGIVPDQRGRGFGQDLTRQAIRWSSARGRSCVCVAVDAANRPALAMVRDADFFSWDLRRVALRIRSSAARLPGSSRTEHLFHDLSRRMSVNSRRKQCTK